MALALLLMNPQLVSLSQEKSRAQEKLRVTWNKDMVTVRRGERSVAIQGPEGFWPSEVKVLFVRQTSASLYFLFELSAPSRDSGGMGQCGGGIERYLVAAEITREWKTGRVQNLQVESCWDSIYLEDRKYDVKAETLCLEVEDGKVTRIIRYDNHRPEQGLEITSENQ